MVFDTTDFLTRLKRQTFYDGQICYSHIIPRRAARYGELDRPLDSRLQSTLELHRMSRLYSHQAQAINHIRQGEDVIVSTSSASGKSMCYNIPVMQTSLEVPHSCAIYLFPTKALSQDQFGKIKHLFCPAILSLDKVDTFDGDTPGLERQSIRRSSRIILTNPDMLHVNMLPNHTSWSRLWRNLRFVIVDEAHAYRGIFGSNVALVLRRLQRICQSYGSNPQFVLTSATIENPEEHACNLIGKPISVVSDDGSPKGGKEFIFWNPPLIDEIKGTRRSANSESANLFSHLISEGIRSICFTRTRRLSELLANYTRDRLSEIAPSYVSRVKTYRAGYMPEERRQIERELSCGSLLGVVATNALELGVDIGDIDATVLTGYPGTIASTWQQAGRSGRREERSLSFLVGLDNPLDQYLMRQPEFFFGKGFENALVNPQNHYILRSHLLCAAWEIALTKGDQEFFGETMQQECAGLVAEGLLKERRGRFFPSPAMAYPAGNVSIRSASGDHFSLIEAKTGKLLETLETSHAFLQAHLGAIYLHQGEGFIVTELDLASKTIKAESTAAAYYTVARELNDVRILATHKEKFFGSLKFCLGEVEVSMDVISFKRKVQFTEEVLGEEPLDLPTQRFRTVALWFDLPQESRKRVASEGLDFAGGIHGAEHAAIGMLPLFAMCDRNDIGGLSTPLHPDTGKAQIFIYDAYPGGVGIAEKGFELVRELWQAALAAVSECPCQGGCPSCIQSPKCGNNNKPLDKRAAVLLLEGLLNCSNVK
jgi:DEAD/DEAH box helicase domain-containing protein